jgi:hypothetical protein
MQIKITDYSDSHYLVIVTTRKGYSYATTWAKMNNPLAEQEVKQAWKENRKNFDPWYGILQ